MKVTGISERIGTYEGFEYHNFMFYGTNPIKPGKGFGEETEVAKVKFAVLKETFGHDLTADSVYALIGREVKFGYNQFKDVEFISVSEEKKKKESA
jgi:hypothetical protein